MNYIDGEHMKRTKVRKAKFQRMKARTNLKTRKPKVQKRIGRKSFKWKGPEGQERSDEE